ncbi:hypothetical protein GCM10022223_42630 [Kineosporia mesophila]|uniref:Mur ligase N-terminal catalytic domain-containing protein n=1 Tax=Kineosporia mesophila TaxID=566012 RepID=A0ABP6ZZ62_9ACTN|nr:Mur ligase domain-containing protein [Kineosporia mesophila]
MHSKTVSWKTIDPEYPVHFVGIGSRSMSGLALLLHEREFMVTGSDNAATKGLQYLESRGIEVFRSHRAKNIRARTQFVVSTVAAIAKDNPELLQAQRMNTPIIDRAELLAALMNENTTRVAVADTSGKTTTTSLIGRTLVACGIDPPVSVGTCAGRFTEGGN